MMKTLPVSEQETVRILEPSVGVGNFIPFILKKFEGKNLQLDIVDIDSASLELAKILLQKYHVPDTCTIRYINDDFLLHDFPDRYDYVIGNPPFFKLKASDPRLPLYRLEAKNKNTSNICSFFFWKNRSALPNTLRWFSPSSSSTRRSFPPPVQSWRKNRWMPFWTLAKRASRAFWWRPLPFSSTI